MASLSSSITKIGTCILYVPPHLIFWVICFYCIWESINLWGVGNEEWWFFKDRLRETGLGFMLAVCCRQSTTMEQHKHPQTGSWCSVILLCLRPLGLFVLTFRTSSLSPDSISYVIAISFYFLLNTISFKICIQELWLAYTFDLLLLLYWQFLGLRFPTLKNQLWHLLLSSFPP